MSTPNPSTTEWVPLWDTGASGGPTGIGSIPGELKLWPSKTLPTATYGTWVWADGAAYDTATYPEASGNIDPAWKTFGGLADPGAGNFRVPDLRGLFAVGMDQMPGGARANRVTRSVAITLAGRTGEEYHTIVIGEVPAHAHGITDPGHAHSVYDPGHNHGFNDPGHLHTMIASGNNQGSIWGLYAGDRNAGTINTSGAGTSAYLTAAGTGIGIYSAGTGITAQNAGGGSSHENMPPTVFVPYIVRLDG